MSGSQQDPYVDPGTGCFYNKLGITDPAQLEQAETDLVMLRAYELAAGTRIDGNYDLAHLLRFHGHLFGDVYPWAGKLRTVRISRSRTETFCLPQFIENSAAAIFGELRREKYLRGLDLTAFVGRFAHYYTEVNVLHPAREGSGRSQRAFWSQVAADAGYTIAWRHLAPEANVKASVAGFHGDLATVIEVFTPLISETAGASAEAGPASARVAAGRLAATEQPRSIRESMHAQPGRPATSSGRPTATTTRAARARR
jgi:cell filamentation protein